MPRRRGVGPKRHLLVDTRGYLLHALVTPGDASDGAGGKRLLRGLLRLFTRLRLLRADQGYQAEVVAWVAQALAAELVVASCASIVPFCAFKQGLLEDQPQAALLSRPVVTGQARSAGA